MKWGMNWEVKRRQTRDRHGMKCHRWKSQTIGEGSAQPSALENTVSKCKETRFRKIYVKDIVNFLRVIIFDVSGCTSEEKVAVLHCWESVSNGLLLLSKFAENGKVWELKTRRKKWYENNILEVNELKNRAVNVHYYHVLRGNLDVI